MKSPSLIAMTILGLARSSLASADPERGEKIRKEYRGSEAPDHLIFAHELLSVSAAAESNRPLALRTVKHGMQFDSDKAAEAFLSLMVVTAKELESAYSKVLDTTVCGPDAPRTKAALYKLLDKVDDLREIKAHNAYVEFISSLHESQQEALTAWLEEDKEGFYCRTAEHKSSYELTGVDVVNHVNVVCAMRASSG